MAKKLWHNLLRSGKKKYYIRGTSTNVNGTETFKIQFIKDGALNPDAAETITCAVDSSGNWDYQYQNKKIYSLSGFSTSNTLTALSFADADDFGECIYMGRWYSGIWLGDAMLQCPNLATLDLSGKKLNSVVSISNMFADNSTLPSINMDAAELNSVTNAIIMFGYQSQYSGTLSLPKATFASVRYGEIFAGIKATAISVPKATFANMLINGGVGGGVAYGIFYNCTNITSVDLSSATFDNLTDARNMFRNCQSLSRIDLPSATFKELVDARGMFQGCSNLEDITWSNSLNFNKVQEVGAIGSADAAGMFMSCTKLKDSSIAALATQTFNSLKVSINAFCGCNTLTKIDLHSVIFGELISCWSMFTDCTNITEIDLSAATFAKVTETQYIGYHAFINCNALITLKVPTNSTAILPTSTAANAPMYFGNSPLTYQSMLNVANWLSDLTGYTAHTCTFKASAWNALTTAEQDNIDAILTAKNWVRAIA